MNCKVEKSRIRGKLVCPTNKSYTHRGIFLASLAEGQSIIKNVLFSEDTKATIRACKALGASIEENNGNLIIKTAINSSMSEMSIDASNSGTTIRITAAIAGLREGKTTLSGDDSLNKRPMQPLLDALESIGAKCTSNNGTPPITVTGKIQGGDVTISGDISSQFVSALMIIGPCTQKGISLNIEGGLVSKPYLDATIASMKKFGVNVQVDNPYKKYTIFSQRYKSNDFTVPSDFSSLALLLSASILIGDNVNIEVSLGDLPQGDRAFLEILKKIGVNVLIEKNVVSAKSPEKLNGGRFDLSNSPDLLPPLAILALKTSDPLEIYNVKHARYKETDRIAIIAKELSKIGLKIHEKEDGLIIESTDALKGSNLDSKNDHRLFMAFCIVGMYIGDCTVSDAKSVAVSYPNFVSEINKIGGKITCQ